MRLAKKRLDFSAAIVALVISVFGIIGAIAIIIDQALIWQKMENLYNIIYASIGLGVFIIALVFSIIMLVPPKVINGEVRKRTGIRITFLIIASIYALLGISVMLTPTYMLMIIPLIAPLTLLIISMSLSNKVREVNSNEQAVCKSDTTVVGQIKELKGFRDLGVIDDAQYNRAVEKLIEKI